MSRTEVKRYDIEGLNKLNVYEEANQKEEIIKKRLEVRSAAGEVVDQRTTEYMQKNNEKDYAIAMRAVLAADPELREQYAGL